MTYSKVAATVYRLGGIIGDKVVENQRAIAVVAKMSSRSVSILRNEFGLSNLVRYVEPNAEFTAQFIPNDPNWTLQWSPAKIEADYAWNTTTGSSSILVAVVDTGVDYTHPDLAANYVPLGHDWINSDADPMDDHGHGTHCAGIIAAVLNNSIGIAGLAQVRVMTEKVLNQAGWGSEATVASGIIHAVDQGADIISMSVGGYMDSRLVHDAVRYAHEHGVLLIAAAGNDNWSRKLFPAGYDEVVAVAATDANDNKASFSNYGDWIEVAAPGVDIYSTVPGGYESHSGTSMACPHVSGVAALIWSQFRNVGRDWVRAQLRDAADDLGEVGFDKYYGYGRVNARKSVEQGPPEHDLMILSCRQPDTFHPEHTATFEVSVFNFGTNDEQNVDVQFFINSGLMAETSFEYLERGSMGLANFSWTPSIEGTYNATFCVLVVPGEVDHANNVITRTVSAKTVVGMVLFEAIRCLLSYDFEAWIQNLTDRGYQVDSLDIGPVTAEHLMGYDVFVVPLPYSNYSPDEILAIQDFVLNGGGLLAIGSSHASFIDFASIGWGTIADNWPEYVNDITQHNVTEGVTSLYFSYTEYQLFVTSPAIDLVRSGEKVMLAVSEVGAGRVVALSSVNTITDSYIGLADNLRLANNMIDWLLRPKHEHELICSLEAQLDVEPEENTTLKATIHNYGLNNETDVELSLIIDNICVDAITIPELAAGASYALNYAWIAPNDAGVCNVTACSSIVLGENVTSNNAKVRFVRVHHPLINPSDGQFAYYMLKYYTTAGELQWTLFNNYTFEHLERHRFMVTVEYTDPFGGIFTSSMILNTMNRFVESGDWIGLWFPIWIETNVEIGSNVSIVWYNAQITGTDLFKGLIDCWEIPYTHYLLNYIQLHDKTSGLMVSTEVMAQDGKWIDMLLLDTNIVIGSGITDLAVTEFRPSKTIIAQGYSTSFIARVENQGVYPKTSNLTVYVNSTVIASQILDFEIGGSMNLTFTWNTTDFAFGAYNITAELSPAANEIETPDNKITFCLIVTIRGDVTSKLSDLPDGKVDMRDIGALCTNFMKDSSSPGWNPNLDINEDELVNMRDIGIACSNFGHTW
jgi:thermitase